METLKVQLKALSTEELIRRTQALIYKASCASAAINDWRINYRQRRQAVLDEFGIHLPLYTDVSVPESLMAQSLEADKAAQLARDTLTERLSQEALAEINGSEQASHAAA
jgi:hypothetical protein